MTSKYIIRVADKEDISNIGILTHSPEIKWFGNIRTKYNELQHLFRLYQTYRFVALPLPNLGRIIAYAEFRNYPAINALAMNSWMEWLQFRYCVNLPITEGNTLFFNFCVYEKQHSDILKLILREAFYFENKIQYMITVRMPDVPQSSYYAENFDDLEKYALILYPRDYNILSNNNTQSLYIINRYTILPKLTYRWALTEDNDDIIAIQESELPNLKKMYGEYYIAEELLREFDEINGKDALIVPEIENLTPDSNTAGFIWLSDHIDLKYLIQNYELESFGNLLSPTNSEHSNQVSILVSSVRPKPDVSLFTSAAVEDLHASTIIGGVQVYDSGISVSSLSKLKLFSMDGEVVADEQEQFYIRESLFLRLEQVLDKLCKPNFYVDEESEYITLYLNQCDSTNLSDAFKASSNVFSLKFIGAHPNIPLKRVFHFLICAFSAFPKQDYCIMCVPSTGLAVHSHIEALKYFMPVAQRPSKCRNLDELYITHRSIILGELSLQLLERSDIDGIKCLILGFDETTKDDASVIYDTTVNVHADNELEWQIVRSILFNVIRKKFSEYSVLTIRCGSTQNTTAEKSLIGYIILRDLNDHHHLQYHFHLPRYEHHFDHKRAEIISLGLHPLFQVWAESIFRELARLTNYTDFYFISSRMTIEFKNDLKTQMMTIEPNARKKLPPRDAIKNKPRTSFSGFKLRNHNFMSDHVMVYRHKLNPSKHIGSDSKIVLIGFTDEAKAMLRQLMFIWNSKDHKNSESFTCLSRLQVTVIASPGIVEAEYDRKFVCSHCHSSTYCYVNHLNSECYVRDVIKRLDARILVHFVPGYVSLIDRANRTVKLSNNCDIYYETLILTMATKFSLEINSEDNIPSNFIEINSRLDKILLFYKCQALIQELPNRYIVLIYGSNLQTYECINFLILHAIDPKRIILVIPPTVIMKDDKLRNPSRDTNIQYLQEDVITDFGVCIHRNLIYSHYKPHLKTNFIMGVIFRNHSSTIEQLIKCDLFVSFNEGYMDQRTVKWLTGSGIEMNQNQILVNTDFKTNDPHIYALGDFIKINKPTRYQYRYINKEEMTMKLMKILKLKTYGKQQQNRFMEPSYFQGQLPLKYYIRKVTLPHRLLKKGEECNYNCSLTTYKNERFCRVVIGHGKIVEEIVLVSREKIFCDFLVHFVGKHESLLNNLMARYEANTINCFFMFFQKPWTELIMHKDFESLQLKNHDTLQPCVAFAKSISKQGSSYMGTHQDTYWDVNKELLEQNVIDFLRVNRRDFDHPIALPEDFKKANSSFIDDMRI